MLQQKFLLCTTLFILPVIAEKPLKNKRQSVSISEQKNYARQVSKKEAICRLINKLLPSSSNIKIKRATLINNACKTVLTLCVNQALNVNGIFNLTGQFILNERDVTSTFDSIYGFFYLISPPDAFVINGGDAIAFPNDGPVEGITRVAMSSSEFILPSIGVYEVNWVLCIDEASQIDVWIDSGMGAVEQTNTLLGRPAGTTQSNGSVFIETTAANSILTLRNASGNSPITISNGLFFGSQPAIGSLTIKKIA